MPLTLIFGPRHIPNIAPRWELGYFSGVKILLGRTQSMVKGHCGPLASVLTGVWESWLEHLQQALQSVPRLKEGHDFSGG